MFNHWLQITKVLARQDSVTGQIPITLSLKEWTEIVMVAEKNKIPVDAVLGMLIRSEIDMVDLVNANYILEKPPAKIAA